MLTHVAIRFQGTIHSLPAPNRHHHIIWQIVRDNPNIDHIDGHGDDQGFLDDEGRYLTRQQALVHALECGQVKDPKQIRAHRLFSEDVW